LKQRNRIEGLRVFNHVTREWSSTSLAAIAATIDLVTRKIHILGVEFVFDGEDDDETTLVGKLKDEDGHLTLLRIPTQAYKELIHAGATTKTV
jgi:hypothetical protein